MSHVASPLEATDTPLFDVVQACGKIQKEGLPKRLAEGYSSTWNEMEDDPRRITRVVPAGTRFVSFRTFSALERQRKSMIVQQLMAADPYCKYCRRGFKKKRRPTAEHVVPVCYHGLTVVENVVLACNNCNKRKAGEHPLDLLEWARRIVASMNDVAATFTVALT